MADNTQEVFLSIEVLDNYTEAAQNVDFYKNRVDILNKSLAENEKELTDLMQKQRLAGNEDKKLAKEIDKITKTIDNQRKLQKEATIELTRSQTQKKAFEKQVKSAAQAEAVFNTATGETKKSLSELSAELGALNKMSFSNLTDEQIAKVKQRIVETKQEITKAKQELEAMDKTKYFANVASSLQLITAGTQAVISVFGQNSKTGKELNTLLLRLVSTTQALGVVSDFLTKKKQFLLVTQTQQILATKAESFAVKADTAAKNGNIAATIGWTVATKALSAAIKLLPIGLIIAAGAALYSIFSKTETAAEKAAGSIKLVERELARLQQRTTNINATIDKQFSDLENRHNEEIAILKRQGATDEQIRDAQLKYLQQVSDLQQSTQADRILNIDQEIKKLEELKGIQKTITNDYLDKAAKNQKLIDVGLKAFTENISDDEVQAFDAATNSIIQLEGQIDELWRKRSEVFVNTGKAILAEYEKGTEIVEANSKRWIELELLKIDQVEQTDKAILKSEQGYYENSIADQQAYEKKLFQIETQASLDRIAIRRKERGITANELKALNIEEEALLNGRKQFYLQQSQELQRQVKSVLKDDVAFQIQQINDTYDGLIKALQLENNTLDQNSEAYERNALSIAALKVERDRLLEDTEYSDRERQIAQIEKRYQRMYENDFSEFQGNEIKKLNAEIEMLEKQIQAKKDAGLTTYDDEFALLNAQLQLKDLNAQKSLQTDVKTLKDLRDARIKGYNEQLELLKKSGLDTTDQQKIILEKIKAEDLNYQQLMLDQWQTYLDHISGILGSLSEIFSNFGEARIEEINTQNENEKAQYDLQLQQNLISREEYDKKVKQADDKATKAKAEAAKKQAILDRSLAIAEIAINTAKSILTIKANAAAAGSVPPPAGPILFALAMAQLPFVIASGVAQTAAVLAAPIPKAAHGKYIDGPNHAAGGKLIEAEGGEVVINKTSTAMFLPLLSAINEMGGGVPFVSSYSDGGFAARNYQSTNTLSVEDVATIAAAVIKNTPIYTTIEDIRLGEKQYSQIVSDSIIS